MPLRLGTIAAGYVMQVRSFAVAAMLVSAGVVSCESITGRVLDQQSRAPLSSAQVRIKTVGSLILLADLDTDHDG